MKTTVEIPSQLYKDTRRYAGESDVTFREVLEMALRSFLKSRYKPKKSFKLRRHPFQGKGLCEGISEGDWKSVREQIYEGRGG